MGLAAVIVDISTHTHTHTTKHQAIIFDGIQSKGSKSIILFFIDSAAIQRIQINTPIRIQGQKFCFCFDIKKPTVCNWNEMLTQSSIKDVDKWTYTVASFVADERKWG